MNITIDDMSPQIGYYDLNGVSGSWKTNHTDDGYAQYYFDKSFHSTTQDGDYMSFTFNGSAVYVYGAKRANHGSYSASIDGQTSGGLLAGYGDNLISVPLFYSENLNSHKEHTVVLTNKANSTSPAPTAANPYYLDIDYIVVTLPDQGKVYTTTYDDESPAFAYTNWPAAGPMSLYYNNTNHLTYNTTSHMSFWFNGTSVQLFGGVNFDHGNYSVVLDGGLNEVFNGSSPFLFPKTSLYLATNLTEGLHSITISNRGSAKGNALDFDYAVVNSTVSPDLGGNNSTNTTTGSSGTSPDESKGSSSNTAAIVGGVVGGVVGLALVAGLVWFFFFRRKKYQKAKTYEPTMDLNGGEDEHHDSQGHHLTGEEVSPYLSGTSRRDTTRSGGSGRQMSEVGRGNRSTATGSARPGGESSTGYLDFPPAAPSSSTPSYPLSSPSHDTDPSLRGFPQADPHQPARGASGPETSYAGSSSGDRSVAGGTNDDTATTLPTVMTPPPNNRTSSGGQALKSATVALPFTARPVSSSGGETNTHSGTGALADRLNFEGHEQDLGPYTLPPNYQQATQPLPGQRPEET